MIKKKIASLIVLVVGIMLAFTLVGCDTGTGGDDGHDGDGDTTYYTWPDSATFSSFGIPNMPAPSGITNVVWYTEASSLNIVWTGVQSNDAHIKSYMIAGGFTNILGSDTGSQYNEGYTKGAYNAVYTRNVSTCGFSVTK